MDYTLVSSTFVIVVLLPALSSRTVHPITYSFGTVNDGGTESSIQYGTHTASSYNSDHNIPSKSLSTHPSRLAHHYYDPSTENSTIVVLTSPANTVARSRKKNHRLAPQVSYIRKPAPATEATGGMLHADPTSTESIVSPVRVRKKGRWLRVRNEIPVNEDPGGETPPVGSLQPSAPVETNRVRSNQTLQSSNGGNGRPYSDFGSARNSSTPLRSGPGFESEMLKNRTRSTSGSVKTNQREWNYLRSTTTENPTKIGRAQNSGSTAAERLESANPTRVLHYVAEASTEVEIDSTTRKPKPNFKPNRSGNRLYDRPDSNGGIASQLHNLSGRNEDEPYDSADRNVNQPRNLADGNDDHEYNLHDGNADQRYYPPDRDINQPSTIASENASHRRKINISRKTTPVPKYKEAYLKRHPNKPRITVETFTSLPETHQFTGASDQETEQLRHENASVSTTEEPYNYAESERETWNAGDEAAQVPGTHHQSLTYSDTEKTEKTEEILHDMEYPDAEDDEEEEGEADEDGSDLGEESPSKILQKPMRYAYSSDQNISESQAYGKPQNEASQAKKKEGGGEKHRSAHHKSEGDKAEEDYESAVEYDKAKKGHSDKENRKHHQEEERGNKKKLHEEGGHQELNHVSSKGEKGTLFGESGSHKKGHSTKGSHNVHKKNEFLKKHEFYDEHHEDDEHKKYGDFHRGHNYVKDDTYDKRHKDGNYSEGHKGKAGKNRHGHRFRQHKGHDDAFKHVDHYANSEDFGEKGRHSEGKKWKYEML